LSRNWSNHLQYVYTEKVSINIVWWEKHMEIIVLRIDFFLPIQILTTLVLTKISINDPTAKYLAVALRNNKVTFFFIYLLHLLFFPIVIDNTDASRNLIDRKSNWIYHIGDTI
jgi:hypothetical protein